MLIPFTGLVKNKELLTVNFLVNKLLSVLLSSTAMASDEFCDEETLEALLNDDEDICQPLTNTDKNGGKYIFLILYDLQLLQGILEM